MATGNRPEELNRKELLRNESNRLEEYIETVFDNAPVMMHSIDENGRLVKVNRLWLKRLGYEKTEVLGLRSVDLLTEESRARALRDTLPLFWRSGSAHSVGYSFVTKTGCHLHLLLDAVKFPEAMGAYLTFAALYDAQSLLQWRQASATLGALRELTDLQPPVDYDPKSELTDKLALVAPGFDWPSGGRLASRLPGREPLLQITTRELEILHSLALGHRNKEIAEHLSISVRTVRFHIENLYRKLEVNSRTRAVRVAFERGYLNPVQRN